MLSEIKLIDPTPLAPTETLENWYAEPFTKRTSCEIPGQCGGDCNCGCPYNAMTELEKLPRIDDFVDMFPNQWLAFITSSTEDEEFAPTHGKLVAHSPDPNEIFDAQNTVLWNQCVYIFFNGNYEAMLASYEHAEPQAGLAPTPESQGQRVPSQPPNHLKPLPQKLTDLIYSALDQLYLKNPDLGEAIRRLRVAKVRLSFKADTPLLSALDTALDYLEAPTDSQHSLDDVIWVLEEALVELEGVQAVS